MATSNIDKHQPEVCVYDFRRPRRLTSGVRQRLEEEQKNLAKLFTKELSDYLRMECPVQYTGLEEDSFTAVLETPLDPVFFLATSPAGRGILLHVGSFVAQAFIDRLLGGPGTGRNVERPPTDIEVALLSRIVRVVGTKLAREQSGESTPRQDPVHVDSEGQAELAKTPGVISSFEVKVGEGAGPLRFFYPQDEAARALGLKNGQGSEQDQGEGRMTPERIGNIEMRVQVRFPPTYVQVREITSLRVGDVLHLGNHLEDEVEVRVEGRLAFLGFPGTTQDSLAVQIGRAL